MAALLKTLFGFFITTSITKLFAKIFGFVTFIYISGEVADFLIGKMFDQLAAFPYYQVLALGGITQAMGIIAGAVTFTLAARGFSGVLTK